MRAAPPIEPPVYAWQYSYSPSKIGQSSQMLKRSSTDLKFGSYMFSGVTVRRKLMYSSEWKVVRSPYVAGFGRNMFICLYSP